MAGRLTRREFLAAAGAVGALGATGAWRSLARAATTTPLPAPLASGIDHIVVVCMENRSFDHFLGWVPNANGQQAGLSYSDDNGVLHPTHQLTDWTGCGFNDPDHSYQGGRVQFDGGACDGFRKGDNDDYALGYYTGADLPLTAGSAGKVFLAWDDETDADRLLAGLEPSGPDAPPSIERFRRQVRAARR